MSASTDFETETAVADWPLEDETGVGGMDEGFCQDESVAFGIADRPVLRGEYLVSLRARYAAWRRRQPSRVRYALVPAGTRITASGLRSQSRLVEIRTQATL